MRGSDAITTEDPTPPKAGFERLAYADLSELTYDAIRRRILARELRTGEQIPVDRVAVELGVSRTPVIDALKRLAAEGLVEIKARRGCFVRELSATDIREIFEVREAIELFAIRYMIRRNLQASVVPALEEAQAEMARCMKGDVYTDYDRFIAWDQAFHRRIVDGAGNSRFSEAYRNLHVHLHIIRSHNFDVLRSATGVTADHHAIVEAIRTGDAPAAEQAACLHLTLVRDKMMANLEQDKGQDRR